MVAAAVGSAGALLAAVAERHRPYAAVAPGGAVGIGYA
jgi:hypothetical protein